MSVQRVRITEVSPRDGLQNEPGIIPTAQKIELIRRLCRAGVDEVEVTSFVSPRWVPQLADAAEVCDALAREAPGGVVLSALVPNERGLQGVLDANARADRMLISKVSVFTAASETFCQRNTNGSIAETIQRFAPVVHRAHGCGLRVRGYVSCIVACPFEGPIAPRAVVAVACRLLDLGVDELDLGDTIGAAVPGSIRAVLETAPPAFHLADAERFTLHLHDTFGQAAACVRTALDMGVRSFDGSVAGLGGCPYAGTPGPNGKRAPGNISTQTLVRTIREAGYTTGASLDTLEDAGLYAQEIVGTPRRQTAAEGAA